MLIGNIVYGICQWGFLSVIAKLSTPEILGYYTLAIAICTPLVLFTNLQLRSVQATDARHEYEFGHYLGLRISSSIIAILILTFFLSIGGFQKDVKWIILIVGLQKITESLSDIVYGYFQNHERLDRISVSIMIRSILTILIFVLVFTWSRSLVASLSASLVAALLVFAFYDLHYAAQQSAFSLIQCNDVPRSLSAWRKYGAIKPVFHRRILFRLGKFALPLGLGAVVVAFTNNVPRYIIEDVLGAYSLGIFGALAYPMLAGVAIVHALAQSSSPLLARYHCEQKKKKFNNLMVKLILIGAFISCGGILVALIGGKPLLTILYSEEYANSNQVFIVLMVVAGLSYVSMFLSYGIVAIRKFKTNLTIQILAMFICALACFLWVGKYQLIGAAFSIGLGYFVVNIASICVILSYSTQNKMRWFNRFNKVQYKRR
jgi:O-antigen/teichoic acid export membrane protein